MPRLLPPGPGLRAASCAPGAIFERGRARPGRHRPACAVSPPTSTGRLGFATGSVAVAIEFVDVLPNNGYRAVYVARTVAASGGAVDVTVDRDARLVVRVALRALLLRYWQLSRPADCINDTSPGLALATGARTSPRAQPIIATANLLTIANRSAPRDVPEAFVAVRYATRSRLLTAPWKRHSTQHPCPDGFRHEPTPKPSRAPSTTRRPR